MSEATETHRWPVGPSRRVHRYLCGFVYFKSDGIFKSVLFAGSWSDRTEGANIGSLFTHPGDRWWKKQKHQVKRGKRACPLVALVPLSLPKVSVVFRGSVVDAWKLSRRTRLPGYAQNPLVRSRSSRSTKGSKDTKAKNVSPGVYVCTRRAATARHFSPVVLLDSRADTRDTRRSFFFYFLPPWTLSLLGWLLLRALSNEEQPDFLEFVRSPPLPQLLSFFVFLLSPLFSYC